MGNLPHDNLMLRTALSQTLGDFLNELEREGDVGSSRISLMLQLGELLAKELNLDCEDYITLENTVRLSGAIKLGLPQEIATCRGGLSKTQRAILINTAKKNIDRLRATQALEIEAEVLYNMHEWYDGSGMPKGLKGDEIPVLSRILSVLTAYALMREGGTYTNLHDREEAIGHLLEDSGTHFDPAIIEAFQLVHDTYYADSHDATEGSILIVDDDIQTTGILSRRLGWTGYSVTTCNSAEEAGEILEAETFDAMIMDIMMPKVDGISFCAELKNVEAYRNLPVILVTCRVDSEAREMARQAGASAFATKPVHFEELLRYLASLPGAAAPGKMTVIE